MNNQDVKYISRVEIKGLWNKYDFSWELSPAVNILAGINGSGKSTVLDCIGAVLFGHIPQHIGQNVDGIKVVFNNGKYISYDRYKINDTIRNLEKRAENEPALQKAILELKESEGDGYNKIKSVKFHYGITSLDNLKMTFEELHETISVDVVSSFDKALKQSEAVKKLSDEKVQTELDWEIYHLQKKYLEYQLDIGKMAMAALTNQDISKAKPEVLKIRETQDRFLNILDELFFETGKKINRDKNELFFHCDSEELSPYQLSSGEKQVIVILLTVLIQHNKPAIFFMDEPEISLHIDWQKRILQYIRELNPSAQLILATHSPAVIMEGWLDCVTEMRDILEKREAIKIAAHARKSIER